MSKKVSIIVPVYNTEKYLVKCLNSLVNQTLNDIEIIIINDGSPDNSQTIIDNFALKYPNLITALNQENSGLGAARNLGIKYSTGEYIGFVDSDDWVDKNMFKELYYTANKEKSDIVICDYYSVSENTGEIWLSKGWRNNKIKPTEIKDYILESTNPSMVWHKLFRKELFINREFLPIYYEDISLTPVLLSYSNKISYLSKPLYYYLQRQGSIISQSFNKKNLEVISGWMQSLNKCNPIYKEEVAYAIYFSINIFLDFKKEYYTEYLNYYKDNTKYFIGNKYIQKAIKEKLLPDLNNMNAIPKIIHFCWFGGNSKNEKIFRCMESWKKHHPDWEIKEWNEDNCDIKNNEYANSAYKQKKWAFVADIFRFKILYEHGGIYLDTDMFINKPLDEYLKYDAFFPIEDYLNVNGCIIGAVPGNSLIKKILDHYNNRQYRQDDGTICDVITKILKKEYNLKLNGKTQLLKDNIAVFSPNIMIINVDDGLNFCEHLYDSQPSWWDWQNPTGESYRYTVLKRYFYNLYNKSDLANNLYELKQRYGHIRFFLQLLKELFNYLPSILKFYIKKIYNKLNLKNN